MLARNAEYACGKGDDEADIGRPDTIVGVGCVCMIVQRHRVGEGGCRGGCLYGSECIL